MLDLWCVTTCFQKYLLPKRRIHILALNPNGTLKWEADYGTYGYGLAIGGDGTIYTGATTYPGPPGGAVYALNPDGTLKWEFDTPDGSYVRTPVAIGLHHRVYAGGFTGFYAIGP